MKVNTAKRMLPLILVLCLSLLAMAVSGCSPNTTTGTTGQPTGTTTKAGSTTQTTTDGRISDGSVTLTYWTGNIAIETDKTMGDTPFYQDLEARTGVKIVFQHPPLGQETEQFNLMISSNSLADLIETNWLGFPGGPEKALADDVIINLNDIVANTAVHLKAYLDANPDVDKLVRTDSGNYYVFPFIRGDDLLMVSFGPHVRMDWLRDLGMGLPETIADWTNMLKAFKNEKNAAAPLSFMPSHIRTARLGSFIIGAYGVGGEFFVDNSTIRFGPIETGFKSALETLRAWYAEGLLDPDYAAQDGQAYNAKITGGKTGAFLASPGSGMGVYLTTMKDDPSFDLSAAPWPVLNAGDTSKFGMKDFAFIGHSSVAISAKCQHAELAARWLDYGYGADGHMLYNFGIEDESYTLVDGYPTYTEYITNNDEGLSMAVTTRRYMRSSTGGPFVQDPRYILQYLQYDQQKKALDIWSDFDGSTRIPPIIPTPDESSRFASIMNEINTYINEEMLKFIMGQRDLADFDAFVEQIKTMGIEDAITIQQAALDRFNSR
jgi:putative aldouronate transport system substrate-binding protein